METIEIARMAMDVASGKQAVDIVLLDTRLVCAFADYFVICNGGTDRHIQAIRDAIDETLRKQNLGFRRCEGSVKSGWVLLDYGNVIIHILTPQEREHYQLEKVWRDAQLLVRMQ